MKKVLAIIFCASNTNENFNVNKNIIDVSNYLNKEDLAPNENFTTD